MPLSIIAALGAVLHTAVIWKAWDVLAVQGHGMPRVPFVVWLLLDIFLTGATYQTQPVEPSPEQIVEKQWMLTANAAIVLVIIWIMRETGFNF